MRIMVHMVLIAQGVLTTCSSASEQDALICVVSISTAATGTPSQAHPLRQPQKSGSLFAEGRKRPAGALRRPRVSPADPESSQK